MKVESALFERQEGDFGDLFPTKQVTIFDKEFIVPPNRTGEYDINITADYKIGGVPVTFTDSFTAEVFGEEVIKEEQAEPESVKQPTIKEEVKKEGDYEDYTEIEKKSILGRIWDWLKSFFRK